ncbi:kappa-casein, partial [Striga asiatica]
VTNTSSFSPPKPQSISETRSSFSGFYPLLKKICLIRSKSSTLQLSWPCRPLFPPSRDPPTSSVHHGHLEIALLLPPPLLDKVRTSTRFSSSSRKSPTKIWQ